MIINLRGTSGSGKSHLVRSIMDRYPLRAPVRADVNGKPRKQPIGYLLQRNEPGARNLYVLGHYETACGGCDTLPSLDYVYEAVRRADSEGLDVLYEGIIVCDDVTRCSSLKSEGRQLLVVRLDTPIEVCLAGIQARRDARGDDRKLNPKNTTDRLQRHAKGISRLKAAGVDARTLGRDAAYAAVCEALRLGPS